LQGKRLFHWRPVVAMLVAAGAIVYAVVEPRATTSRLPSPSVALGVGRAEARRFSPSSERDGVLVAANPGGPQIGVPDDGPALASATEVASPAPSPAAALETGGADAGTVSERSVSHEDAGVATASVEATPEAPLAAASLDEDHLDDRPTPADEEALMTKPRPLTSSRFDEEDLIDRHPVPYERDLARSAFDDQDLIEHHPVPDDEEALMSKPRPITSSSFDEEDLIDRHPVPR
jgi:hypothetical protein